MFRLIYARMEAFEDDPIAPLLGGAILFFLTYGGLLAVGGAEVAQ